MSIRHFLLAITTSLVACHSDSHSSGPTTVVIHTDATPYLFLALRDGDGPWTQLDTNTTDITVHDDYQLIAACGDDTNGFETIIQGATVNDGGTVELPCFGFGADSTPIVASGTMVQAGTVAIGLGELSITPNWPFEFDVTKGFHSLLAIGDGKAITVRFFDLETSQTLPTVDTSSGLPLTTTKFTLNNLAPTAATTSRLTANLGDFMVMPETNGTNIQPLPDVLLLSGDFQHLEFLALNDTGAQFASVDPATTSATSIDLLPQLTGITFENGQAAWSSTLPDGDIELDALVFDPVPSFTHLQGTAAWLGAQTSLAIDTLDIPGFQPEWLADTSVENLSLSVSATVAKVFLNTEEEASATLAARDARSFRARRRSQDRLRGR